MSKEILTTQEIRFLEACKTICFCESYYGYVCNQCTLAANSAVSLDKLFHLGYIERRKPCGYGITQKYAEMQIAFESLKRL